MKRINIEKEELKRIINELEKASKSFDGFGCLFWDVLTENEAKRYGEGEVLLTTCIRRLNKVRKDNKKTI